MTVNNTGRPPRKIPGGPDVVLEEALKNKVFPGIAVQVNRGGKPVYRRISGLADEIQRRRPLTEDALWGLASLTKPLATTPVLLHLMEAQGVADDAPLGSLLPEVNPALAVIPLNRLMTHTAGLPPVPEMFRLFDHGNDTDRERAIRHLYSLKPLPGTDSGVIYSCTGYILLGLAAEVLGGAPLNELFETIITGPAGISDLGYRPAVPGSHHPEPSPSGPADGERAVTEEYDPWRGRWIQGEVHDENAWTLGGVSGNAGLFGSLDALTAYSEFHEQRGVLRGKRVVSEEHFEKMTNRQTPASMAEPRAYGFACPYEGIFAGPGFSEKSFGHTGFVGTSFWRDPERDLTIIILTNRVHYGREKTAEKIKAFRREFHREFL